MRDHRPPRVARPPNPRPGDVTSGLPNPGSDPQAYLDECLRRLRVAVRKFARIEARMGEIENYYIEKTGSTAAGLVAADSDDEIVRALAPDRETVRKRVQLYASAIEAEVTVMRARATDALR